MCPWDAVQKAVVALPQTLVAEDRHGGTGERNLRRLDRPPKVRNVDSNDSVASTTVAELTGEAAATLRQLSVEPTRRAPQLVVLAERVRLEDQAQGHDL